MTDELTKKCQTYSKQVHYYSNAEGYFFPMIDDRPLTLGNIYKNFRKFLWKAGISHAGRGSGPRIHDFSYPNLNKIQTFQINPDSMPIPLKKGLDF